MHVEAYLERIGLPGSPRPDPDHATLVAIHRAHSLAIPYENLDIQLGRPVGREPEAIYDKLVRRGRGGWCYEMNGLLLWALRALGFAVTPVAGAVGLEERGAEAVGNHLVLLVALDGPYLADVGFGDGFLEPIPLRAGRYDQGPLAFGLVPTGGDGWHLVNHREGGTPGFHFEARPADERQLDDRCHALQTDPGSPFVLNAALQIHLPDGHATLRGKTLSIFRADGTTSACLGSAGAYVETLRSTFGLDLPEAAALWPRIEARHAALFPPAADGA